MSDSTRPFRRTEALREAQKVGLSPEAIHLVDQFNALRSEHPFDLGDPLEVPSGSLLLVEWADEEDEAD